MAAPMLACANSDSSISDPEPDEIEQKRSQETADVDCDVGLSGKNVKGKPFNANKRTTQPTGMLVSNKPSLRPSEESHDDENQLETTPEFRDHVAMKLSSLIDSKLDVGSWQSQQLDLHQNENETEFRLFSSSTFTLKDKLPVQPARKRPTAESSTDSESEDERLASAAISGSAILAQSAIHVTMETTEAKTGASEGKQSGDRHLTFERSFKDSSETHNGDEDCNISSKKRKKKKHKKCKTGDNNSNQSVETECVNSDTESKSVKTKHKKKKTKKSKNKKLDC